MCHVSCKQKPATRARINPYPCSQVRVCWGWGTGSPGKPQGYPRQSLALQDKRYLKDRILTR